MINSICKESESREIKGNIALVNLLCTLRKPADETIVTIKLIGREGEPEEYTLKAYTTDLKSIKAMKKYANDVKVYGCDEGYQFNFIINPDFTTIKTPYCDCGDNKISDNFTLKGNRLDSNCDTWGSFCGAKAQSLYLFYIKETKELMAVQVRYWVV